MTSFVVSVVSLGVAAVSAYFAHQANKKADEANELARRTHEDNIAQQSPQLTVTDYVLSDDGLHVTVHNAGLTPARDVYVRLANPTSFGSVGEEFDPHYCPIVEVGAEVVFSIHGDADVLMERTRMGTDLSYRWKDNIGRQYEGRSNRGLRVSMPPSSLGPSPLA